MHQAHDQPSPPKRQKLQHIYGDQEDHISCFGELDNDEMNPEEQETRFTTEPSTQDVAAAALNHQIGTSSNISGEDDDLSDFDDEDPELQDGAELPWVRTPTPRYTAPNSASIVRDSDDEQGDFRRDDAQTQLEQYRAQHQARQLNEAQVPSLSLIDPVLLNLGTVEDWHISGRFIYYTVRFSSSESLSTIRADRLQEQWTFAIRSFFEKHPADFLLFQRLIFAHFINQVASLFDFHVADAMCRDWRNLTFFTSCAASTLGNEFDLVDGKDMQKDWRDAVAQHWKLRKATIMQADIRAHMRASLAPTNVEPNVGLRKLGDVIDGDSYHLKEYDEELSSDTDNDDISLNDEYRGKSQNEYEQHNGYG